MSSKRCPYCGSYSTHKSIAGWGESTVKTIKTLGISTVVGMFSPHHGGHMAKDMLKNNSNEYESERCGKKIRHSEEKGSYKG